MITMIQGIGILAIRWVEVEEGEDTEAEAFQTTCEAAEGEADIAMTTEEEVGIILPEAEEAAMEEEDLMATEEEAVAGVPAITTGRQEAEDIPLLRLLRDTMTTIHVAEAVEEDLPTTHSEIALVPDPAREAAVEVEGLLITVEEVAVDLILAAGDMEAEEATMIDIKVVEEGFTMELLEEEAVEGDMIVVLREDNQQQIDW
mmetsp:Transcript_8406/g.11753  ORF Transcript_8406/g.11753 Transcript_8406/m.11753 type:complete len:202 (+) Transcript_8406:3-608(+)